MRYGLASWEQGVEALQRAGEVAVACHVNPDGDALGSSLAASLALRKAGKKTQVSWGETPLRVPDALAFLPGVDHIVPPDKLRAAETFLAVDCGAADRLGVLEPSARAAQVLINVDHHPGNDLFGTINLVAPDASSSAELVTMLLRDLGTEFDQAIATCLYTGVVTDTGRFSYSNSSPETLRLAADLLGYGVPARAVAEEVFESSPYGYLKLVGRVLDRARLIESERLVYSWLTLADLEETGVAMSDTDKLIDLMRSTRDADVAVLFKQQPGDGYRVSLRSKGPSVGAIARANGGGGHDLAAGFTAEDVEDAVGRIRAALDPPALEGGPKG